jgi:hypothetical protein
MDLVEFFGLGCKFWGLESIPFKKPKDNMLQ